MFALFNLLILIALGILEGILGVASESEDGVLSAVYILAVLLPFIAVAVRRLHDGGHNGWWLLISLVPLVGSIIFLVFMIQDPEPGQNAYGLNPSVHVSDEALDPGLDL